MSLFLPTLCLVISILIVRNSLFHAYAHTLHDNNQSWVHAPTLIIWGHMMGIEVVAKYYPCCFEEIYSVNVRFMIHKYMHRLTWYDVGTWWAVELPSIDSNMGGVPWLFCAILSIWQSHNVMWSLINNIFNLDWYTNATYIRLLCVHTHSLYCQHLIVSIFIMSNGK